MGGTLVGHLFACHCGCHTHMSHQVRVTEGSVDSTVKMRSGLRELQLAQGQTGSDGKIEPRQKTRNLRWCSASCVALRNC